MWCKIVLWYPGLDPAGPGFFISNKDGMLDATDAIFVDVIHTSGWWAGFYDPVGDVDFYPNGGFPDQPGCSLDWGKLLIVFLHCFITIGLWFGRTLLVKQAFQ